MGTASTTRPAGPIYLVFSGAPSNVPTTHRARVTPLLPDHWPRNLQDETSIPATFAKLTDARNSQPRTSRSFPSPGIEEPRYGRGFWRPRIKNCDTCEGFRTDGMKQTRHFARFSISRNYMNTLQTTMFARFFSCARFSHAGTFA